jgi:pimeloyl-ACP methyl ester carboxylesterase
MSTIKPEEKTFVFNNFRYASQYWGGSDSIPAIALHGWLDNSASFSLLAPKLKGLQVLAPDLGGHGFSDHRSGFSAYPLWGEISEILAMADTLAWDKFILIGHSRGGMIAQLIAAIYPERVSHLVVIDALSPFTADPETAPQQVRKSHSDIQRRLNRPSSVYSTYEKAIQARCASEVIEVNKEQAELLASRGLSEVEGGFHWHSDGKLWGATEIFLTEEQVNGFLKEIKAKTLLMIGKKGITSIKSAKRKGDPKDLIADFVRRTDATLKYYDDGHYPHMGAVIDQAAEDINNFILSSE